MAKLIMLKTCFQDVSGPAIVFKSEDKIRKEVSWKELKVQVAALANFLKTQGVLKVIGCCLHA